MNRIPSFAVPASLNLPCDSQVAPPVQTCAQSLPYEELSWQNFERLCLRLARAAGHVESCRFYGVQGNMQSGIDLYGKRQAEPKYTVYQCKNEAGFGPTKIRAAVEEFLKGTWVHETCRFVLCTRESLTPAVREDEVKHQKELLTTQGIDFEPWDQTELDLLLKAHPRLVHEFFGPDWLKLFIPQGLPDLLSSRRLGLSVIHISK